MSNEMLIKPVAYIRTDFKEKFGIPRQSGRVPATEGRIVFDPEYRSSESLREIESFSHLWLIFGFSENSYKKWTPTVRPPRLGGNKKVGVFASRSPYRPNCLGLSSVRLLRVDNTETEGNVLIVSGADLLDNTPIYDIKPYLAYTDCHEDAISGYAEDFKSYRLSVEIPDSVKNSIPHDVLSVISECLADDPRPSYQDEPDRVYGMKFADYDVRFTVSGGTVHVISYTDLKNRDIKSVKR